MRVIMLGTYPPPIGGISVHVSRLSSMLVDSSHDLILFDDYLLPRVSVILKLRNFLMGKEIPKNKAPIEKEYLLPDARTPVNFARIMFFLIFGNRKEKSVVHFHSKNWKFRAMICMTSLLNPKNKVVVTIHSLRDEYSKLSQLNKLYLKFTLKFAEYFIVTNDRIAEKLVSWGTDPGRIEVIPPFLPPAENPADFARIPDSIWEFIETRHPVITANAFKISFYQNEDLYGIDMCIDLCDRLKSENENIGFVFCLPDIGDEKYYSELLERIKEKRLSHNFLFVTEAYPYYPILKKSDIFVRPTNTDGDALSIREALHFKTIAVASDVVGRPGGTLLFKTRDKEDFYLKVRTVIDNYDEYKSELIRREAEDNFTPTLNVYNKIMNH